MLNSANIFSSPMKVTLRDLKSLR